ncbi:hypothetical protein A2U01_0019074, partial [Trifolium medium]|nr:hypothetical protein [Trifolium medium]
VTLGQYPAFDRSYVLQVATCPSLQCEWIHLNTKKAATIKLSKTSITLLFLPPLPTYTTLPPSSTPTAAVVLTPTTATKRDNSWNGGKRIQVINKKGCCAGCATATTSIGANPIEVPSSSSFTKELHKKLQHGL